MKQDFFVVNIDKVITQWYRPPEILLGQKEYDTAVDIWSAGCIISELKNRKPLLQGDCEIAQIFKVFQMFGTPTEAVWPGVTKLPDWMTKFPRWGSNGQQRNQFEDDTDPLMIDLIEKMLIMNPRKRITGYDALHHVQLFDS